MNVLMPSAPAQEQFGFGDVVHFPKYGTTYIVHRAPVEMAAAYHAPGTIMLARLDGQAVYQRRPMTWGELAALVRNLGGKVFSRDKYHISLLPKVEG